VDESLTVLYVVGHPRSGSTIVGNVFGEIPGVFHAGELYYLWTPGLPLPRQRCGCGADVRDCALWREVFSTAFGMADDDVRSVAGADQATVSGLPGIDASRVFELQRRAVSSFPSLRASVRGRGRLSRAASEYLDVMDRLYRAIATVSGSSVIVDSSKWAHDAALIGRIDSLDVRYVHLVREPWGVVYSRLPRDRPDTAGSERLPSRWRLLLESARWVKSNALAEIVLARSRRSHVTLRYEDFVADCNGAVARLAELVGLESAGASIEGGRVVLGPNHTTGGNRNRWQSGEVTICQDRKWRDGLRNSDRRLISTATWPYRLRYGYVP
jgi:hypothetical protein